MKKTWRDFLVDVGILTSAVFVALSLVACGSTSPNDAAKVAIVAAYNAQGAAAQTYNEAKAKESAASQACAAAAVKAGLPVPSVTTQETWPRAKETCASLGAPIPFDPFALQKLAGPINALTPLVEKANKIRVAFEGGTVSADVLSATVAQLAAAFIEIEQYLVEARVTVPKSVDDAAVLLKTAGAGK